MNEKRKNFLEFQEYFNKKKLTPSISRNFLTLFKSHIKENPESFIKFWEFVKSLWSLSIEEKILKMNDVNEEKCFYKTFFFVADWCHSYLGQSEILFLLVIHDSVSGGKKFPDIIFNDSPKRIEIKSYDGSFRVTESTFFFTDLGTIIQSLVQGGFLSSLTDINNKDLKRGISQFRESFLCERGFIELNSGIWKLEFKSEETITFRSSPETKKEFVQYSIVRNSLRNWISRGVLSIKLGKIIDPNRTSKISKKELQDYVKSLLGLAEKAPISLEQYFILCGINYLILYEKKNKKEKFKLILFEDLGKFSVERISQSKVSYKNSCKIS